MRDAETLRPTLDIMRRLFDSLREPDEDEGPGIRFNVCVVDCHNCEIRELKKKALSALAPRFES
jgi:hypothetical protein